MIQNRGSFPPIDNLQEINLDMYSGVWYDYAHTPQRFLVGCSNITAEYKIESKRYVSVYNSCIKESGEISKIKGKAFPVKGSKNAKLKVQFFWPFRADYWILDRDENYQYALVGGPSRSYLWILSREPVMDEALYEELVEKARALGFNVEELIRTVHEPQITVH